MCSSRMRFTLTSWRTHGVASQIFAIGISQSIELALEDRIGITPGFVDSLT